MSDHFSNNAVIPVPNTQIDFYDWPERRRQKVALIQDHRYELIFMGDSITHMFELPERGEKVWRQYFGEYHTVNLGYGWDCTQNLLWRLENGEFTNQQPRVVVLNIGTNNLTGNSGGRANSASEIVEAILAICSMIHRQSPKTTIIVMSTFPRGAKAEPIHAQAQELAAAIKSRLENSPNIVHLDIGQSFLNSNGEIRSELLDDLVHPTEAGYQIWAEKLHPIVSKYLKDV